MDLFLALLPAILMITLVIATRRVLLSLGLGVFLAALVYSDFNLREAYVYFWDSFNGIITDLDWYMPIVGFVILIGGITSVIALSGGIHAFADWAVSKVKNPVAAKLLTWVLGLLIFIDDYFNALVIGEISKPITDKYKVSRAKLAYIIDSTSAPVVILMPISTWGAYIIGILGGLFENHNYTNHSAMGGFLAAVPYQFYPITAIVMVFVVAWFGINIGKMKEFEENALEGSDTSKEEEGEVVSDDDVKGTKATQWTLIVPVGLLIFTTVFMMFLSAGFSFGAFLDQDITIPLFVGGVVAFIAALIFGISDPDVKAKDLYTVSKKGMMSMVKSAVAILILAWMISGAIQDLELGEMIADIIASTNITGAFLPFLMFFVAAFIAFETGTSWGAFGILLPIAVPIVMAINPLAMPAVIAAVLGGAVVGDHSSPVSDTTVLSATGAQSTLYAHFISQLPYVMITAGIAALGYLVYGITQIIVLSYLVLIIGVIIFVMLYKKKIEPKRD